MAFKKKRKIKKNLKRNRMCYNNPLGEVNPIKFITKHPTSVYCLTGVKPKKKEENEINPATH